jgi:uncharacterized membrane protein YqhA
MLRIQSIFEHLLWNSRFVVLTAVVATLLGGMAMFLIATIDAYELLVHVYRYATMHLEGEARVTMRSESIAHIVELIDGYLLGTVMLIFSLGLYELFISKIDPAESSERGSKVLLIHSLDDLKSRLGQVVLMILIVRFFERALVIPFESALEGLFMGASIALIGLALYLSHAGRGH